MVPGLGVGGETDFHRDEDERSFLERPFLDVTAKFLLPRVAELTALLVPGFEPGGETSFHFIDDNKTGLFSIHARSPPSRGTNLLASRGLTVSKRSAETKATTIKLG